MPHCNWQIYLLCIDRFVCVCVCVADLRIRRQHSSESMSSINSAASHSSMGSAKDADDKKKKKKSWVSHCTMLHHHKTCPHLEWWLQLWWKSTESKKRIWWTSVPSKLCGHISISIIFCLMQFYLIFKYKIQIFIFMM